MNTLTCVYCGHEYPEGTPPHGAQILTDHIRVCEKHPLRLCEKERDDYKSERDAYGVVLGGICDLARAGTNLTNEGVTEGVERVIAERNQLRKALVGLVGSDNKDELAAMELAIQIMPAPAEDIKNTVNAIHAIRDTAH